MNKAAKHKPGPIESLFALIVGIVLVFSIPEVKAFFDALFNAILVGIVLGIAVGAVLLLLWYMMERD